MTLKNIKLQQFRSHQQETFEFSNGVTMIIGPNGSGKTNILEAIHTLLLGKSFRDSDDELVSYGEEWWRLNGSFKDGTTRDLRYQPSVQRSRQLSIDNGPKSRFTYRQQLPAVLFEPDDLLMIHGSPSGRRVYIDNFIQKLDPTYKQTLNTYERALTQRNNLLKQRLSPAVLKDAAFAWDVLLAEHGMQIVQRRLRAVELINKRLSEEYSRLAGSNQVANLTYLPSVQEPTSSHLAAQLNKKLALDAQRGFTTVGPHRDDIEIELNSKSAKHTASRGEVRSLMLALKLVEVVLIEEARDIKPILLLDDVFSELDKQRQGHLLSTAKQVQTIITTTESDFKRQNLSVIQLKKS